MNPQIKHSLDKIINRKEDAHKGSMGHILVLAGSRGYTGAATLTAMGALRTGAGLVTVGCPRSIEPILEIKLTEAMTYALPETKDQALSADAFSVLQEILPLCHVIALGPGLGRNEETFKLVRKIVKEVDKPIVLDADGLNAFENHEEELKDHAGELILTPHPGEIARLVGKPIAELKENREEVTAQFIQDFNVTLVFKDHQAVVASSIESYINDTGNPGMATGGMGDVLTGMIAALWAQGLSSFEAASLGVYLHGSAGDKAAEQKGEISLLPTDLLDQILK